MDAVYGIAHVLLGRDDEREGEHAGGGDAVVQPKHPAIDVHVGHVEEATQLPEYFQHGVGSSLPALVLVYARWIIFFLLSCPLGGVKE